MFPPIDFDFQSASLPVIESSSAKHNKHHNRIVLLIKIISHAIDQIYSFSLNRIADITNDIYFFIAFPRTVTTLFSSFDNAKEKTNIKEETKQEGKKEKRIFFMHALSIQSHQDWSKFAQQ